MGFSRLIPRVVKQRFGDAVEWRVKERLMKERDALAELSTTFVELSAEILDRLDDLERQLIALEERLDHTGDQK